MDADTSDARPNGAPPRITRPALMLGNVLIPVESPAVTATLEKDAAVDTSDDDSIEPPRPLRPVPAALAPWRDPRPWLGWAVAAGLMILAGFTRFWALGFPQEKIFDEAYYATESQEILRYGYEDNRGYMFIVHPPLGKWLIAFGTWLFGDNSFGWRVVPAVFGCLTVLVVARTARRMFRSNLFGAIAGLLIAVDGMSLVLARTALLDVFLEFFVAAAFGALVVDRDQMRARLARLIADGADLSRAIPTLGPRPWRLIAGISFGLASAVKWTGPFFYVAFAVLCLVWDRAAYKAAGCEHPFAAMWRRSALPALGSLVLAPIATYLTCNLGWFTGENSWGRHWADVHSPSTHLDVLGLHIPFTWAWVPAPIRSLGAYTLDAFRFHEGLDSGHAYASNPWSWLVDGRPVDFYYKQFGTDGGPVQKCGESVCSREVLLIGTPLLWWAFVPMLLWLAWHWITTRDWRAASVWVAFLAGWLVWFHDLKRTMFMFYMGPLMPFMVFGLTLALGTMLGPAVRRTGDRTRDMQSWRRRRWGTAGVTVYLALVLVDFAWMWPLFTGALRTYTEWHWHMWLPSWV
jgi:dolichyl-phosphate-mannose--protein O-mannosyl transferase